MEVRVEESADGFRRLVLFAWVVLREVGGPGPSVVRVAPGMMTREGARVVGEALVHFADTGRLPGPG